MSYIESVLQRLLIPDSSIIKQATKQLLEYFVSALFFVLHIESQITQKFLYKKESHICKINLGQVGFGVRLTTNFDVSNN